MTFPQTVPDRRVNLEWKRQLFLVYKEALTNILRHAQATEVMITIEIRGEQFTMMVTDNGIGFDPGSISHGNGLKNMRARAGLIGATLEVESASGRGTRLSLSTRIT